MSRERKGGEVDIQNSTTTPLNSGEIFTGEWKEVVKYNQATILIASDIGSALVAQFSTDGVNIDRQKTFIIGTTDAVHTLIHVARYFRIVLTNNTVSNQSYLRLQVVNHFNQNRGVESTLTETINDYSDVTNVRSILVGRDTTGTYRNCELDNDGHLRVNLADPLTAFGEIQVSNLTPIVQQVFQYGPVLNSRMWDTSNFVSGGTATVENNMIKNSTSTTTGSSMITLSRKRLKYRAGEGILWRGTFLFENAIAGGEMLLGIGDELNGFFFGYNGADFGVCFRSGGVDTWILQSSFNIDPVDGTATLPNLNWQNLNIGQIQIGFLGTANVKFSVYNPSINSNEFIPVHIMKFAGENTTPHLGNATLPIYFSCDNGGTTNDLILRSASCMLSVQGTSKRNGFSNTTNNTKTPISTTETAILSIRNNATHQGSPNTTIVYPITTSAGMADGKRVNIIKVLLNTTLGGTPNFVDLDSNASVVAIDTAGTTVSGGTVLGTFLLTEGNSGEIDLGKLDLFLEPGDILTVSSVAQSTDTATITAISTWIEDF